MIARGKIERAIDALLALLDASEPDPDLEEGGDDEPSISGDDREEDSSDNEPWLGWTVDGSRGLYPCEDLEMDHDNEPDYVHGDADSAPSLNGRPLALGEVR